MEAEEHRTAAPREGQTSGGTPEIKQLSAAPEDEMQSGADIPEIKKLSAAPENAGMRLDAFLAASLPEYSRSYLKKIIEDGGVLVNGTEKNASFRLHGGDAVTIRIPAMETLSVEPENIPLDILYEDEDVLIVNKPKGMVVHPAPGHPDHTLVNAVLYHCGSSLSGINGVLRPGIVHRIDQDTTGSLIVCKNDRAHRFIAEQIAVHSVTRIYLGICEGRFSEKEGTVRTLIGRSTRDRKKMAVVSSNGKPAVTHYRVLEQFSDTAFTEFRLETGRTHQIRVHMAYLGHPLLGDMVYGHPSKKWKHLEGQTLHAWKIGFIHPRTGSYMEFEAPLPEYFESLLDKMRKSQ